MAMNLFGSSLEEIQTRAKQQAEVRRVRAMQQAAQQGASPINTAMAGFGNQIGTRLFGGDQPSEADKLRALSEEDITANMMQYGLDTPAKAIKASNLAFQAGHLEMGMKLQQYARSIAPKAFAYNDQQEINKTLYSTRIKTTPDDMPSLMDLGLNTTELFGFTQDQSDDASQAQLNSVLTRLGNGAKEQAIAEQFTKDPTTQFKTAPESDYYYIRQAMALANKTGVLDDLFKDGRLNTGRLPSFKEMKAKEIQIDRRDAARGVYDETAVEFTPQPKNYRISDIEPESLNGLMEGTVTPSDLITQQLEGGLITDEAADYRRGKYAWMQANPEIAQAWVNDNNNKQDLLDSKKAEAL
ncbi:MAG: hypothetical protein ACKVJK_21785, partial [Methylophagaceae bacterium]